MIDKTTFGVIVGTRGFFNSDLAKRDRARLLKKIKNLGYETIILPESATPNGVIETIEDGEKCGELFNQKRKEINGIIVSLPNFGDEIGILSAIQSSGLKKPILIQAADDYIDKVDVSSRRDAFCGKLSVCNNLYQNGIPYTDTTEHTIDIEDELFSKDIHFFAGICRVINGISKARIGVIGTRPAPFQTVRISEKILQASGITVVPVDLSEIIFNAKKMKDSAKEVVDVSGRLNDYGIIPEYIKRDNILKQSKLYLSVENWIKENNIDAFAMQCWTSIQENYGCAACATLSMLGNKLIPGACEADIGGAIAMYMLTLASKNASALIDWNNNYGDDRNKCVVTHCSSYPKDFMGRKVEISNLDVLGESLGKDKCFGAIKGKVAPGPMTFFRVDTDDTRGIIRSYLGQGGFTDDPFDMAGGIGVCKIENLRQLLGFMCKNGFEHHGAMVRSHCADIIEHAISNYTNWSIIRHK